MNKFYEVQVKLIQENGKKSKETYLINAMSTIDAESYVNEDFKGITLEWEISSIKESKICKILPPTK